MQAKWLEKPYHFYSYKEFILSNLRFIYLDETLERPLNKIKLIHFQKASRYVKIDHEYNWRCQCTLIDCSVVIVEISLLSQNQRIILTVFNTLLMLKNIVANSLVLYILIKTKQIRNITCKLIFAVSVSETMQRIFVQNLYTGFLFKNLCSAVSVFLFISIFFLHVSVYTIAVLGIDRYLRIKQPVKFKVVWKTKTVFALISIATFNSLLQAIMSIIGLLVEIQYIISTIYYLIDGSFLVAVIVLQLLTIRTSNAVHKDSTIDAANKTNKVITILCMRIMISLCFFFAPY